MKILLGMSGGLDSTYAARKLLDEGHIVEGAVLLMHEYTEIAAAEESARTLGIPLHVIDCREEFQRKVVSYFTSEYLSARTPNPCVVCNSDVKFRQLLTFAQENRFDKIATGHYANIEYKNGRYSIKRSSDEKKDQTYVLWRLPQDILAHLVFPLCDTTKAKVREDARARGILAADREESQEICFIPSGDYATYIEERYGVSPSGDFVDTEGRVLGKHNGIIRYTIGQRKGLGIALGARAFVVDIDITTNRITLSFEAKQTTALTVTDVVYSGISEADFDDGAELLVKLRYLAPLVRATVKKRDDGSIFVSLLESAKSVTPGQSAVFYVNDRVAFGGLISQIL